MKKAVIVGASGKVGRLLARQLRTQVELHLFDLVGSEDVVCADVSEHSEALADAIALSTMVINCLPEPIAEAWAPTLSTQLRAGMLLVDTLSVKAGYLGRLQLASGVECLSINPLFAPDLGFSGRGVAYVSVRGGPATDSFLASLRAWGATPVALSARDHDEAMAVMQAGVHGLALALGALLDRLPPALLAKGLGPPPFQMMLLLVARMLCGHAHVYWDIQRNPAAHVVRQALTAQLAQLDDHACADARDAFEVKWASLRRALSADLTDLNHTCAELFGRLSALQPSDA